MKLRSTYLLFFIIASTFAYCGLLALDLFPHLRGPQQWRWAYGRPGTYQRLWLPALLLVLHFFVAKAHLSKPLRKTSLLLWCLLFTPALQLALLYMDHPDVRSQLFYRVASSLHSGYFSVGATATNTYEFLNTYTANMPSFPVHAQRHPPGLMLLFLWARQFVELFPAFANQLGNSFRPYQCHNLDLMYLPSTVLATVVVQMSQPLITGFVVFPLYAFGNRFGNGMVARSAVLMWPILPSVALWTTTWNITYSLLTVGILLLIDSALRKRSALLVACAGVLLSLSLLFTIGNVLLIGLVGVFALVWLAQNWEDKPTWLQLGQYLIVGMLATASIWIILWAYAGLSFWDVLDNAMSRHLGLSYDYWTWVFFHPYDFFVFLGVPLAILWAGLTVKSVTGWRERQTPAQLLSVSFALFMLIIVFSGTSQGEVSRVWGFLYPIPLVIAAYAFRNRWRWALVVLSLLSVQTFVGNVYFRLHDTGFSHPPAAPQQVDVVQTPVVTWSDGIALYSAETNLTTPQTITTNLVWQAEKRIHQPQTQFLHLINADGELVAQSDSMPLGGAWATTCWIPNAAFAEERVVTAAEPLPPGTYDLVIGWYYLPTGERTPLIDSVNSSISIGKVNIPAE